MPPYRPDRGREGGPVGLYFGRSDPGGVINFVTKKPNFLNRTEIKLGVGNDSFVKGVIDHQASYAFGDVENDP